MIRALTILGTIVALAVSAAPVASAGTSKKPPSLEGVSIGAGKDRGWFTNLGAANDMSQLSLRKAPPKPKPKPLAEEVSEEL